MFTPNGMGDALLCGLFLAALEATRRLFSHGLAVLMEDWEVRNFDPSVEAIVSGRRDVITNPLCRMLRYVGLIAGAAGWVFAIIYVCYLYLAVPF